MFRLGILMSVVLCLAVPGRAEDKPSYLCYGHLPTQAPVDVPLDFPAILFDSGFDGSGGSIAVLNKSDKAIKYYVIVIEFLDEAQNYLVSAPVYNVVNSEKDQSIPLDVPFKPWLKRNWPGGQFEPIPAKSLASKTFEIALSMLTCPASARVSAIQLRYDDDTEFRYMSPTLNISTTPSQEMVLSDIKGARRWSPTTVTGKLKIDVEGRARILEVDGPEAFRNWLQREFSGWRFIPAWVDGKPTATELAFVFFLEDASHPWLQIEVMKRKGARGAMLVWPHFN
jgi:hypothetical protein